MSIQVRNTMSEIIATIEDGNVDKSKLSINLFGKGTETYLKPLNENFLWMLSNFAGKLAPKNPIKGQLWFAQKGSNIVEARGTGLNYNASRYLKINGVNYNIKNRRGLALIIFDNNFKSALKFIGYYDVYGSNSARTNLARKLKTISDNEMFVLISYDAIGTNKELSDVMINKLGSQDWYKVKRNWRYPYAAIGTGKFGIISEELQPYDAKKHAYAYLAFESLIPSEGMGYHTRLNSINEDNSTILVWNGETWDFSANKLNGKTIDELRDYVLSKVDLSTKFLKSGGTIAGSVYVRGNVYLKKDIIPTGNEIQDIGNKFKRVREIHLSEDKSIYMGEGKEFNKNSFVYTVMNSNEDISYVPNGSLIINRENGEAVIKKDKYVATSSNKTFRGLTLDKKYGSVIGGNNYNFMGDNGIFMGSWRHGKIVSINIPTPSNGVYFGNCNAGGHSAGASDATRGLSFWQHSSNRIQYITIATPMNAINFGKFNGGWGSAAVSDGVKAITIGGRYHQNGIEYVNFATPMNSVWLPGLTKGAFWHGAVSDGVKAVFDQGYRNQYHNVFYQFVMQTPFNVYYFGKMTNSRGWTAAVSNGVVGLWMGGHRSDKGSLNTIEKLTIATNSNSVYFGNLSYSRHTSNPVGNDNYAVANGGNTYSRILDYVSFNTPGNAKKFGTSPIGLRYTASFSGN